MPYIRSDLFDAKIRLSGHLRGHDEGVVLHGGPTRGRLPQRPRLTGVIAEGLPPKILRHQSALVAAPASSMEALTGTAAS